MSDVEAQLRAMLRDRAGDIGELPSSVHGFDSLPDAVMPPAEREVSSLATARAARRGRTSRAWLLSAAAVAVIGAGLAVAVTHQHDSHPHPDATNRSDAATRLPDRGGPRTTVALGVPAAAPVPGFYTQLAVSNPGFRWIGWQASDTHPDVDDVDSLSAQAVAFDAGRFPLEKIRFEWTPVTLTLAGGPTQVFSGRAKELATGQPRGYLVPTLAWRYGPDRWAAVQGLSESVTPARLRALAGAFRPATTIPTTLPFSLANPPAGTLVDIVDRQRAGRVELTFSDKLLQTKITVGSDPGYGINAGTPRTVDGRAGIVDSGSASFDYDSGQFDLEVDVPSQDDLSDADAAANRLLDGLTWSGRRGEGPGIPLRAAIGH